MSDDGETRGYGDTHRAFLQALLARQAITFKEAKPLIATIQTARNPDRPTLEGDVSQQDFDAYIEAVNNEITKFDFEIRSTLYQRTKERIYALVNTTSDALTQMATLHTADEIAFVKRVLDDMFDKNNTKRAEVMAVTSMQALKLAKPRPGDGRRESGLQAQTQNQTQSANAGLTMSQAEKVLENLVAEGWFELSTRGFYTLTPRALIELRGWLTETYNEQLDSDEDVEEVEVPYKKIKKCEACGDIVTIGQRCPNVDCEARMHDHCAPRIWRARGNQTCPQCKADWKAPLPVGEAAARGARRSSGGGARGGRRSSGMGMDGAADEESSDDSDD